MCIMTTDDERRRLAVLANYDVIRKFMLRLYAVGSRMGVRRPEYLGQSAASRMTTCRGATSRRSQLSRAEQFGHAELFSMISFGILRIQQDSRRVQRWRRCLTTEGSMVEWRVIYKIRRTRHFVWEEIKVGSSGAWQVRLRSTASA